MSNFFNAFRNNQSSLFDYLLLKVNCFGEGVGVPFLRLRKNMETVLTMFLSFSVVVF